MGLYPNHRLVLNGLVHVVRRIHNDELGCEFVCNHVTRWPSSEGFWRDLLTAEPATCLWCVGERQR